MTAERLEISRTNYPKLETPYPSPLLDLALPYVPMHDELYALDLGSGTATANLDHLVRSGFRVVAIDSDPNAITILAQSPLQEYVADNRLQLIRGDFTMTINDLQGPYHLIHGGFSLFTPDMEEFVPKIAELLSPEGVFCGQVLGVRDQWNKPDQQGLHFYLPDSLQKIFKRNNLKLQKLILDQEDGATRTGKIKYWDVLHFVASHQQLDQTEEYPIFEVA